MHSSGNGSSGKSLWRVQVCLLVLVFAREAAAAPECEGISLDYARINLEARTDYRTPVRPGEPGMIPFWNPCSQRFLYAPAFDFPEVEEAVQYRFRANDSHVFMSERPWDPLSPIWDAIPVGPVALTVEALDADGQVISVAGNRQFYRAAPFVGPYRDAVVTYRECALKGLYYIFTEDYVQSWKSSTEPDPGYSLYCYPSKVIGAVVRAMALYGKLDPEHRDDALLIAKNAADYLMRTSQPADAPLPHWPLTYSGDRHAAPGQSHLVMWQEPSGVATGYLDLFDATGEKAYFEAAIKIAVTYEMTQSTDGSWPLKADLLTGNAVTDHRCIPTAILALLDRLMSQYGETRFASCRDAAFEWIMMHPVRTYNWTGQFEDVDVNMPTYANLQRADPASMAVMLMSREPKSDAMIATARELIRFCEDQFVVWDQPNPDNWGRPAEGAPQDISRDLRAWSPPCALEQYAYYVPVDASAASMIFAYSKAYEVTGERLYLAKAEVLANMMTIWQDMQTGYFPTRWLVFREDIFWLNCAEYDISALLALDDALTARPRM